MSAKRLVTMLTMRAKGVYPWKTSLQNTAATAEGALNAITKAAYSVGLKKGSPTTDNIVGTMKTKQSASRTIL